MYVPYRPALTLAHIGASAHLDYFPFNKTNLSFWHGGSQAIYQGARALGLQAGDGVLVPAYSCGSEADPLLKLGLVVHYYHITSELVPDFTHLTELCETLSPKALLVTHFFGLPQPMSEVMAFVAAHGLLLIEDNAHGLYGVDEAKRPLGSYGHAAVFSLGKSLPLPDGGALLLNDTATATQGKRAHPVKTTAATIGVVKDGVMALVSARWPMVGEKINGRLLDRIGYRWLRLEEKVAGEAGVSFEQGLVGLKPQRVDWHMSGVSRWLLARQPHEAIQVQRWRNFSYLLGNFPKIDGLAPLFKHCPEGCAPLVFPVLAETAERAEGWAQQLRGQGVIAYRWWSQFHDHLPAAEFPFEVGLKQRVVALPLHQDVGEGELGYMIGLMDG